MPLPTTLSQNGLSNMAVAFDMLMEEIEIVLHSINKAGASAFEANDYDKAYRAIGDALKIKTLYQNVSCLKEELNKLNEVFHVYEKQKTPALTPPNPQKNDPARTSKQLAINCNKVSAPTHQVVARRIGKGLRTQEPAFFYPILQALSDLGGSAKRKDVFDLIERSMKDVLKPIDYQTLPSECGQTRWQNSAQWARNLMVKEGLLRADSRQGMWEITDKGRAFLKKNLR